MITSRANARLKALRQARRGRGDHMLVEGPHLLAEALACGQVPTAVVATSRFLDTPVGRALGARLPFPPLTAEPALLDDLADSDSPRGVVALVPRPDFALDRLPVAPGRRYLLLDGVQDPGNVGALARTAEAAGVAGLVLGPGCARPDHPRALRASAGSLLRLPVARDAPIGALERHLAPCDPITWAGLVAHGGAPLYDAVLAGTTVLVAGAEGRGLTETVADRITHPLTIPLEGEVESLNVATAAAVVLFELARRDPEGIAATVADRQKRSPPRSSA